MLIPYRSFEILLRITIQVNAITELQYVWHIIHRMKTFTVIALK